MQVSNFPKKFYMKIRKTGIGPGGWKCNCCGPAPKHRKAWCKMKKNAERVYVKNLVVSDYE